MTSRDPFDLEEQLQLSKENSRVSQHIKSQSEPTTGFLDDKGSESREYGSDLESTHTRSSSMNRSEGDRSTSRQRGVAARYRPRRPTAPTALQRHLAEKNRSPGSAAASRNGSFDSTKTDSAAGDNYEAWLAEEQQQSYMGKSATERRGRKRSRPTPHVPAYDPDHRIFMPVCPRNMKNIEKKKAEDDGGLQTFLGRETMYYTLGLMEEFGESGENLTGFMPASIVLAESGGLRY
jgi:hypothetical protein